MKKRILALTLVLALGIGFMPGIVASGEDSVAVETTPVESMPIESTPVESTPVESTPVSSVPDYNAMTAEELYGYFTENAFDDDAIAAILQQLSEENLVAYYEYVAALDNGADPAPAESTPVESTPVESTPVESTPVESTPVTPVVEEPVNADELLARMCDCKSPQELWAFLRSLTEAEWSAMTTLADSEEELAMMREFANGECPVSQPLPVEVPETVDYTDAGELKPPVEVQSEEPVIVSELMGFFSKVFKPSPMAELQDVDPNDPDDNGLAMNKTAVRDGDNYKITLEAYTTGIVTTTTTPVPVDIVLVLDQSGSMTWNFDGISGVPYLQSRQYAMKESVKAFIQKVNGKYSAEGDHRISIVTYGASATQWQGWTSVDAAGATTLLGRIDSLPTPTGSTNVAAGMTMTQNLMGSGYNYSGSNNSRQKVVIVFTDGLPTTSDAFSTTVASGAINAAKSLKDSGATIYSIGILTGANPDQLYASTGFDVNSNGTLNSYWEKISHNSNELTVAEIPAGNRFLNYLSSNSSNATSCGLQRSDFTSGEWVQRPNGTWRWAENYYNHLRFTIINNYSWTNNGYFLTASNQTGLDDIFTNLSELIGNPSIDLDNGTVLKDTISQYFDLLNGATINTYTVDKTATGWSDTRVPIAASVTTSGKEVSISGFDYNANFVSSTLKPDGTYGKKLVVELYVVPEEGFLGGNDVPTNTSDSGIYVGGASIEPFEEPVVDVPVHYFVGAIIPVDSVVCIGTGTNLDDRFDFTELDAWNNDYVDIQFTLTDNSTPIPTVLDTFTVNANNSLNDLALGMSAPLFNCTDYTLTAVVTPTEDGTITPTAVDATSNVHVLKPTITWSDTSVDMGDDVDLDDRFVSISWADVDAAHTTVDVSAAATWTVDYAYSVGGTAVSNPDAYAINSETGFDVTVTVNGADVTQYVNFVRNYESSGTDGGHLGSANAVEFVIFARSFDLTITKTISGGATPTQSFIFDVTNGSGFKVSVVLNPADFEGGEASITIYGLPSGDYTVTERGNWSWQYVLTGTNGIPVSVSDNTADFTNTRRDIYWLGDSACALNIFNKKWEGGEPV